MWTLTFLVLLSLALGIGAWLFFVWSVRSGQYDDVEGPKHRMLDDEEEPPAAPPTGGAGTGQAAAGPGRDGAGGG